MQLKLSKTEMQLSVSNVLAVCIHNARFQPCKRAWEPLFTKQWEVYQRLKKCFWAGHYMRSRSQILHLKLSFSQLHCLTVSVQAVTTDYRKGLLFVSPGVDICEGNSFCKLEQPRTLWEINGCPESSVHCSLRKHMQTDKTPANEENSFINLTTYAQHLGEKNSNIGNCSPF